MALEKQGLRLEFGYLFSLAKIIDVFATIALDCNIIKTIHLQ